MIKKLLFCALAAIMTFAACACVREQSDGKAELRVSVLRIGKADAIIITAPSGEAVLIDSGEEDDGDEILNKLQKKGIKKLDYMIITHYDKDHVGGAAEVILGSDVKNIFEPGYEKKSKAYNYFADAAMLMKKERTAVKENTSFSLGGAVFTVYAPKTDDYDDENDFSLAVMVEYEGRRLFFTGDALDERMAELMEEDISADLLKVPHHGSYEELSDEFFAAVSPEFAVITCSDKNPPDSETVESLQKTGAKVYLTSDGDVEIAIGENGITVSQ